MKKMKKGIVLLMALALALSLALPIPALAQGKTPFTAQIVNLSQVDPGGMTSSQQGNLLIIQTTGEVNQAQVVGSGVGFDGTLTTTHNSVIAINLVSGAISGRLEGTFTLTTPPGSVITGTIKAVITGQAVPVDLNGDGVADTFWTSVTDIGRWQAPALDGKGTFTIQAEGVIGVNLSGGGVLHGVIGD